MKKIEQIELEGKKEEILKEIRDYNKERDQIKMMLGRIGGTAYSSIDMIINIVFLTIILSLFALELTTHWLPSYISLEVSVLLVSIKIVWMIHSQYKTNHFQFWILNSIEYRMNVIAGKIKKMEKDLEEIKKQIIP